MKILQRYVIPVYLLGIFTIAGCYYDNEEVLYPKPALADSVSFSTHISPLIRQNCAVSGCHAGTQSPVLTTHQQIFGTRDRIKARAVDGSPTPMPPTGLLPKEQRDKIASWINAGAPDN